MFDGHEANWRGGTDCWCDYPTDESIGNSSWWYRSPQGVLRRTEYQTGYILEEFSFIQSDGSFAQSWYDCDNINKLGMGEPNLEWAISNCRAVEHNGGYNGWGNAYDTLPSKTTAPYDVHYGMRCEFPGTVAPNCLCPPNDQLSHGACWKNVGECTPILLGICSYKNKEWGRKTYSSSDYCRKLNVIVDRPLENECDIHAHCAPGLQCHMKSHCILCNNDECPDKSDKELDLWGAKISHGDYLAPIKCLREGNICNPHIIGISEKGCCLGLKCDKERSVCIQNNCKNFAESCSGKNDNICPGYFCLNNQVVNGEGRECSIEDNGLSSNCTISGTYCDEKDSGICKLNFRNPVTIYLPYGSKCDKYHHSSCDEGLYCDEEESKCVTCQVDKLCPEKISVPSSPTCIYGEYLCPNICSVKGMGCSNEEGMGCCRGLKCVQSTCVEDSCKRTGECSSDNECCDGYACLYGIVIHAVGQWCYSPDLSIPKECRDGTICDNDLGLCVRPHENQKRFLSSEL